MKITTKKESQPFKIEGQEGKDGYLFSIEVIGIKTKEDIEEIIRQCRLVENQLTDELTLHPTQNSLKGHFAGQLDI